jgi:hypothetical protein
VACLFAVAAVAALYRLPLGVQGHGGGTSALGRSLGLMPGLLASSPYFYAIVAAILTSLVLRRRRGPWVQRFLRIPSLVESFGGLFTHVVPVFTLLMGAYIVTLPAALRSSFAQLPPGRLSQVELLGFRLDATTTGGIFRTYLAIALLTGILSWVWHLLLLVYTRARLGRELSIPFYLRHQFLRLYPLLWATCSEALATPFNLYLMKKNYPRVREPVRHMAASLGSIFNVNGTIICCFTMIPPVFGLLGIEVSAASLLLSAPLIYLLGFAVPGIPGELVLFAGPIMKILSVPPTVEPVFLAAFIGLQLGLPDSFRSGVNSTDNCLAALLINHELDRSESRPQT